jgi:hypothetical protein
MNLEEIEKAFRDAVLGHKVSSEARRILPGRDSIELYRQLILGAASGQLSFAFEETLEDLVKDGELSLEDLLLEMLRENPPRTQSSRELAERFLSWVLAHRADMFEGKKGLKERMERLLLELQCFYSKNGEGHILDPEELQSLGETVEALLASSLRPAPWLRFWRGEEGNLFCSRDEEGMPFWREAGPDLSLLLECLREGRTQKIGDLAESWLEGREEKGGDSETEEQAFMAFLGGLLSLAQMRGLLVPQTPKEPVS